MIRKFTAIVVFLLFVPQVLFAQSITVRVRSIKAAFHMKAENSSAGKALSHHIDKALDDLSGQLATLPYQRFRLLDTAEIALHPKQRETVPLPGNNQITLRPLYMQERKVGLWLKWVDGSGKEVLDTRLHFDSERSMLAGTDNTADSAMILAIDVKPASR
jgi:hypothetical protein